MIAAKAIMTPTRRTAVPQPSSQVVLEPVEVAVASSAATSVG
jgi:hypothetical protein